MSIFVEKMNMLHFCVHIFPPSVVHVHIFIKNEHCDFFIHKSLVYLHHVQYLTETGHDIWHTTDQNPSMTYRYYLRIQ